MLALPIGGHRSTTDLSATGLSAAAGVTVPTWGLLATLPTPSATLTMGVVTGVSISAYHAGRIWRHRRASQARLDLDGLVRFSGMIVADELGCVDYFDARRAMEFLIRTSPAREDIAAALWRSLANPNDAELVEDLRVALQGDIPRDRRGVLLGAAEHERKDHLDDTTVTW